MYYVPFETFVSVKQVDETMSGGILSSKPGEIRIDLSLWNCLETLPISLSLQCIGAKFLLLQVSDKSGFLFSSRLTAMQTNTLPRPDPLKGLFVYERFPKRHCEIKVAEQVDSSADRPQDGKVVAEPGHDWIH